MVRNSHPFLFIFLFLSSLSAFSYFDFTPTHQKIYKELLYMQVPLAKTHLTTLDKKNGCTIGLYNTAIIMQLLSNDNPDLYDSLKSKESEHIKLIHKHSKNSPYALYYEAEIKLHWSFVHLNYGNEISAFFHLKSVKNIIKENIEKYPDFIPNKKIDAIINLILGSIPGEYKWITDNLGLKGDHYKGIILLNEIINSNHYLKEECMLLKSLSYIFLQQDYFMGYNLIQKLSNDNPESLLYNFILVNTLLFKHDNEKALKTIARRPKGTDYEYVPQYTYFTAECYLQKLELTQAKEHYLSFIKNYKGKNHIKSSYFKLYLIETLQKNPQKAAAYLNKIDITKKSNSYPDKYAIEFAKNPESFHPTLIKVRLLQDGGYYEKAKNLLLNTNFTRRRDLLEKEYRLGRVYHFSGSPKLAKEHYKKSISYSKEKDGWYYAPNACLQLAYMYEGIDNAQAYKYYTKALTYKQHPYKGGIDDRAKQGLNRIKK